MDEPIHKPAQLFFNIGNYFVTITVGGPKLHLSKKSHTSKFYVIVLGSRITIQLLFPWPLGDNPLPPPPLI